MDDFVTQLFSYIPAKWQPYVAILLLILWVVTKIRSHQLAAQVATMQPTLKSISYDIKTGVQEPKPLSKLEKAFYFLLLPLRILC